MAGLCSNLDICDEKLLGGVYVSSNFLCLTKACLQKFQEGSLNALQKYQRKFV
jgi:hypothetical protein